MDASNVADRIGQGLHTVIVPGGFGERGFEGTFYDMLLIKIQRWQKLPPRTYYKITTFGFSLRVG